MRGAPPFADAAQVRPPGLMASGAAALGIVDPLAALWIAGRLRRCGHPSQRTHVPGHKLDDEALSRIIGDHALRARLADASWAAGQGLQRWSRTAEIIAAVLRG